MTLRRICAFLTLAACAQIALDARRTSHVLMVSIDGLMPSAYTQPGPAKIPTLRRLAREGAFAEGVVGVLPTVTYPSHTTLISGVLPSVHGIVDNHLLDPEGRSNGGWFWYARDIKRLTLLTGARARGLRTAAVNWPVTVGAQADLLVPEYDRSDHPENLTLLRALATPQLLDAIEIARKKPLDWPFHDRERTDMTTFIMRTYQPNLMLVHLVDLDSAQHADGPGSPRALETLERIDGHISEMAQTVEASGLADDTTIVVVSDHGFLAVQEELHPNAAFREKGWLLLKESGTIDEWRVYFLSTGGSGYVYLKDPGDSALEAQVGSLLEQLKADPSNGIESIWTAEDLRLAGAHPDASFGIDMRNGFSTGGGHRTLRRGSEGKGSHGFAPTRPELHASLIIGGSEAKGVGSLGIVRMTQIAPTIARWLGVQLSPEADRALSIADRPGARP